MPINAEIRVDRQQLLQLSELAEVVKLDQELYGNRESFWAKLTSPNPISSQIKACSTVSQMLKTILKCYRASNHTALKNSLSQLLNRCIMISKEEFHKHSQKYMQQAQTLIDFERKIGINCHFPEDATERFLQEYAMDSLKMEFVGLLPEEPELTNDLQAKSGKWKPAVRSVPTLEFFIEELRKIPVYHKQRSFLGDAARLAESQELVRHVEAAIDNTFDDERAVKSMYVVLFAESQILAATNSWLLYELVDGLLRKINFSEEEMQEGRIAYKNAHQIKHKHSTFGYQLPERIDPEALRLFMLERTIKAWEKECTHLMAAGL